MTAAAALDRAATLEAMKSARRWLLASPHKIPHYVSGRRRHGELDTEADRAALASYPAAVEALLRQPQGWTLGFALGPDGEGYWQGIDLDKIEANGLDDLLRELPGYVETSPSGAGAHAIGYGRLFETLGSNRTGIEAYAEGRFFTVTEDAVRDAELCCLADFVETRLAPRHQRERPAKAPDKTENADADYLIGWLYDRPNDLARDEWVRLCLALKGQFGDRARDAWLSFSGRYTGPTEEGEAERVWETARPAGRVSIGTIVRLLGGHDSRSAQFQRGGAWVPHEAETGEVVEPDLLPLADLAAWGKRPAAPTEFLLSGLIPKKEWAKLDAIGGGTKSTFALQLAICRAAGRPFLGVDLDPGVTLYENAEDSFDRVHWLTEHICRAQHIDIASLQGRLHISSVRGQLGNELATFDHTGRLATTTAFGRLKATIGHTGADFVILDNLAHLYAGNENDRGQVTAWINLLYSLDVTGLLLGHPNKAGDSYSGTTAWLNAMRAQLIIERLDELDPDSLTLRVGKANYARPGETLRYRWHNFALWLEDDLPTDTRAEIADTIRANGDNELFLHCLRLRNEQQRPVSESPASRTYAPRVFAEMAESKKIGVRRLEAAMERLFRINRIERGFVGRIDRKDKEGLRECAEVRAEPALTGCADVRSQGAPSALSHTPSTTYYSGAAHEAAAPSDLGGTDA